MPARGFNWRGKQIEAKMLTASRRGIDVTLAACVPVAKQSPPLPVVTGTAQGSIQFRPSIISGRGVTGIWGSFSVGYFIWLEIGARGRPGGFYLRRSADENYPKLARNIRAQLARAA